MKNKVSQMTKFTYIFFQQTKHLCLLSLNFATVSSLYDQIISTNKHIT